MDAPTMRRPMTPEELNEEFARPKRSSEADTFRMIGSFVQQRIDKATAPLKERIDALDRVIAERRYVGVWAVGKYHAGNMVTHDGSVWHCDRETDSKPGQSDAWTLCVKRGRDGKDGRDAAENVRRLATMQRA